MLVEIWSDVVCPWCAIGKARFDKALAAFPRAQEVEVAWRSFELDRHAGPSSDAGISYASRLAQKYRTSVDQANVMIDRMTEQAAQEGLTFDFSIANPGNTFDAHRVIHLAADRDRQHQVKARFMQGYLSEGAAISRHEVLVDLATEAGLERDEVEDTLAGEAYADAVRADEAQAMEYGISGVPFFVLDGRIGVSGAQPVEALVAALDKALPAASPLEMAGTDPEAAACGIDGC
ncbi:DsbA family oxidoreductase [Euzebya tangerina]|uniref:DsbA family oxidoreductase n=1 Tax=Euzebya tangerina TaxID=591198 RepID=UPI000E322E9D|nr:DsbA family oxidoreductase [Euzebya tangerina]